MDIPALAPSYSAPDPGPSGFVDLREDGPVQPFKNGESPDFSDIMDIVNPLQHIPIVNTLYRHASGDNEGFVSDLIGGALYGGIIGLVIAMADTSVHAGSGKSIGANVVTALGDIKNQDMAIANDEEVIEPRDGPVMLLSQNMMAAMSDAEPPPASQEESNNADVPAASDISQPTNLLPGTQGTFNMLGDNQPPATVPSETDDEANVTVSAIPTRANIAANQNNHFFPLPERRGGMTPKITPQIPTTGPAALPGGRIRSMAVAPKEQSNDDINTSVAAPQTAAMLASSPVVTQDWFVARFNDAMDKYKKAATMNNSQKSVNSDSY